MAVISKTNINSNCANLDIRESLLGNVPFFLFEFKVIVNLRDDVRFGITTSWVMFTRAYTIDTKNRHFSHELMGNSNSGCTRYLGNI